MKTQARFLTLLTAILFSVGTLYMGSSQARESDPERPQLQKERHTVPSDHRSPATPKEGGTTINKDAIKKGPPIALKKFNVTLNNLILLDKNSQILPKDDSYPSGNQPYKHTPGQGVIADVQVLRQGETPELRLTAKIKCQQLFQATKVFSFPAGTNGDRVKIGPMYPNKSGSYPENCQVEVTVGSNQTGWFDTAAHDNKVSVQVAVY